MSNLSKLFNPDSIAVVGVSESPEKIGSVIFNNIIASGFKGDLYAVNPKYKDLYNHVCYKSLLNIPHSPDIAIISIPSKFVKNSIKEAAKKEIPFVVIISAGFSEIKNGESEHELLELIKDTKTQIVGPNCLGFISTFANLNASFAASNALSGDIAFVSQSGALCTLTLDLALEKSLGFSHFVSIGNKIDIHESAFLNYFNEHEDVKVIAAYLEDIEDGDKFYTLLKQIEKPVVILKPGKSLEAQKAISSHTGSLASPRKFIEAAVRQSNNVLVEDSEELFNTMLTLSWSKPLKGKNICIITNAGGPGVIMTDLLVEKGFQVGTIRPESELQLNNVLDPAASKHNPIDLLGTALASDYEKSLKIILQDKNVDGVVVIVTPQLITQLEETAKTIINLSADTDKPIFTVFLGGHYAKGALARLYDNKILGFQFLGDAALSLSNLYTASNRKYSKVSKTEKGHPKYKGEIHKYLKKEEVALPTKLSQDLLNEFDIETPAQMRALDTADLNEFADKHGFPLVLKAESEDIAHKTEFKALYLNINNKSDLYDKFNRLRKDISKITGKAESKIGILLQRQLKADEELFAGITRDGSSDVYVNNKPGFGHLLVFGKGGIHTEVYKDISFRLIPFRDDEITSLIAETKVSKIINGFRGSATLAKAKLEKTLLALQNIALTYPEISSIDINPLFLTEEACIAVDVKIFVKK